MILKPHVDTGSWLQIKKSLHVANLLKHSSKYFRNQDAKKSQTLKNCFMVEGEHDSYVTVTSITKQCHVTPLCDGMEFPPCEVTMETPIKITLECRAWYVVISGTSCLIVCGVLVSFSPNSQNECLIFAPIQPYLLSAEVLFEFIHSFIGAF